MKRWNIRKAFLVLAAVMIFGGGMLQGCSFRVVSKEQEREDVAFVIVSEECIPKELAELIEQKKESEIKLTYADKKDRYIIVGYGEQKTGGYSIYIKDVYKTSNALYVDTCLLGPKKGKAEKEVPSYPVIVLRVSEMGLPVVFQ